MFSSPHNDSMPIHRIPPCPSSSPPLPPSLPRGWPSTSTHSTSSKNILSSPAAFNVISAILTTFELDEIPTAAAAGYVYSQGMVAQTKRSGKVVQRGVTFWVYPTGHIGPFEDDDDGRVILHGLLVTIERGALFEGIEDGILKALPSEGMAHVHFKGVLTEWDTAEC